MTTSIREQKTNENIRKSQRCTVLDPVQILAS
uniref:Uncharacterized protein n=1 Tax=Anguilla anguilla TaxID=7936 RepID=A0A0E9V8Y3_ANGAN